MYKYVLFQSVNAVDSYLLEYYFLNIIANHYSFTVAMTNIADKISIEQLLVSILLY